MTDSKTTSTNTSFARTPLYDLALEQNARFTSFSGWEMPVQFSGLKQEHQQVRTAAGMFDISHMGKFVLRGKELKKHLQRLVPSDLSRLQLGQAQYSVLLNSQAGIIDDIIFYYQGINESGEQQGILIVNAGTTIKDKTWLLENLDRSAVTLEDISLDKILIAVQGPKAIAILQSFVDKDLAPLPAFGHLEANIFGEPAFIARTGYTGEDGCEVMLSKEAGKKLWRSLSEAGVSPCGLGARDTLRLEAAMCLYGQDIDDTTTPLEAGLSWVVHFDTTGDFIGRSVLSAQKAQGLKRRLVAIEMSGRHIARHDYPVIFNGEVVGKVTSGTLSPTLEKAIALAYVSTDVVKIGQQLEIEIRGKTYLATVVKKPFYRSPHRH
ncbi:MAG: glycine cleavage system aminomethyltransferase GcvT [Xenococcaceae cyanobacterium]